MYIVIELQKANKADAGAASLVNTYENYNEAESRYYTILAYAALSGLFLHGAYLFSEDGRMIMNRQYITEPPPEPVVEESEPMVEEVEPEQEAEPLPEVETGVVELPTETVLPSEDIGGD